jgi:ferredoxin
MWVMEEFRIMLHPENCVWCEMCQLQCSFSKTGTFNPAKARIKILRSWEDDDPRISFTNDCDQCGICAKFCVYGALEIKREE